MESPDQYNFSIFSPRNLHGKKNRNVILTMLLIWAVAVFGFQLLLRIIEKPTPEKALTMFESAWPSAVANETAGADYKTLLNSMVLVRGKNIVKPGDQKTLNEAISLVTFKVVPDSVKALILGNISELAVLRGNLIKSKDAEYLNIKTLISEKNKLITVMTEQYSGFKVGSLEANILTASLVENYPESITAAEFSTLPAIMSFYLTHNQSKLTDTKFLGFPFHYFYTAVFLLILFIALCIVYNILIEWRLVKEGIVE
jgi:putative solute:sodium symporter small subunit